jgi:hypothetical protein
MNNSKYRQFEIHLLLGSPDVKPHAWHWSTWRSLADELNSVLVGVPEQAALYSRQTSCNEKRDIPFGRMTWSENANQRWTHGSPLTTGKSENWEFADMQVWSPSRSICQREQRRPDAFFQLMNAGLVEAGPLRFNPIVVLAVGLDLRETLRAKAEEAATNMAGVLKAKLRAFKVRPWARPAGLGWVQDSLDSIDTWLFRGVGSRHQQEPTIEMFKEEWHLREVER